MTRFCRSNPGRGRNRKCTEPISAGRPTARLIELVMRAFRCETPGRTRKRPSRIAAATITSRCLKEKIFTAQLSAFVPAASHRSLVRLWLDLISCLAVFSKPLQYPFGGERRQSPHDFQCSSPASLIEEVQYHVSQKTNPVSYPGLGVLVPWR